MAVVKCGKCGAELILPETSSFITGTTVSKESKGDYVLPMRDSKGRFTKKTTEYCETEINNNSNTKENETMMNANNNGANNNINGGMNMNGFDMNALAAMVAQMVQTQMSQSPVTSNTVTEKIDNNINNVTVEKKCYKTVENGGRWAKNSAWYGKEICGFIFNPYMIRWHLQKEFERLMKDYDYNVHKGISNEYPYMYSVNFTVKEIGTLAFLEKNDRIAFDERKNCFTLNQCKRIMTQYYKDVIDVLEKMERELVRTNKVGKETYIYLKKLGKINVGIVSERIVNHKVEKYMDRNIEFEALILSLRKKIEKLNMQYGIWNYKGLYELVKDEHYIKVPAKTAKSRDFMDCFIRSGAYYTLKQTLMFKEGTVLCGTRNGGLVGRDAVLELMRELKNGKDGYIIYKYLKLTKGYRY